MNTGPPGGRYAGRVRPQTHHIGGRATVRFRIPGTGPSGGPAMSDAVGIVREVTESHVVVERKTGEQMRIPTASIVVFHPIATGISRPRPYRP